MRTDYGIDAPGLVRTFFVAGGTALATLGVRAAGRWPKTGWSAGRPGRALAVTLGAVSAYTLGMGAFMLYGSRIGKLRRRDMLLDALALAPDARVLDVGCGRGLLLVGAARRVPAGRAVGIDVWAEQDQGDNRPEATLANARAEGVEGRIEVLTGDARALPFADDSFDAVVSHWVVHNIACAAERATALAEMTRVLRPGGRLVVADIEHQREYMAALAALGLAEVELVGASWGTALARAVSFGSFCPTSVVAQKPALA